MPLFFHLKLLSRRGRGQHFQARDSSAPQGTNQNSSFIMGSLPFNTKWWKNMNNRFINLEYDTVERKNSFFCSLIRFLLAFYLFPWMIIKGFFCTFHLRPSNHFSSLSRCYMFTMEIMNFNAIVLWPFYEHFSRNGIIVIIDLKINTEIEITKYSILFFGWNCWIFSTKGFQSLKPWSNGSW